MTRAARVRKLTRIVGEDAKKDSGAFLWERLWELACLLHLHVLFKASADMEEKS